MDTMKPSDELFQRALRLTPWGTQTKSKRPYPFFEETMPKFIVRGKGCRVWDMEGKEYIDFRLALGPITLGYCNEEVDNAVRAQLNNGVLFSMASPLEAELAGLIARSVPNVDMCRFLKTGADANLTNVRIARATTGRDLIVTCGYHGSTDWFATAGSPENGVPSFMQDYVRTLNWGDSEAAEKVIRHLGDRIACVVTVPWDMNEDTSGDFVRHLRKLTEEYGILLVLDEVLTGFRLALGGAQEFFGVKADLVSYAKALANGYPLSAAAGGRNVMENLDRCKMTTT
ncbi:MAG TPA: aminotransferase class III-fold pyridoxal phosphate-dependent enzyme, partial [Bacteroidota bacterium]